MLLLPRLTLLAALLAHSLWEETGGEAAEAATEPPKPLAKMVCGTNNEGGCKACRAAGCGWCQESQQCVQDQPNRCQDGFMFHIGSAGATEDCGICDEMSCCRESKICKKVEEIFGEKVWGEKCDTFMSELDKGSVPQPLHQLCPCSCKKCPEKAGEGPPMCETMHLETLAETQLRDKPFQKDYKDWSDEDFHVKTAEFIKGKVDRHQEIISAVSLELEEAGGAGCDEQDVKCRKAKNGWLIQMDELEARKVAYTRKIKGIHKVLGLPDPGCVDLIFQCDLVKVLDMCEESCAGIVCKDKCKLTCGECTAEEEDTKEL